MYVNVCFRLKRFAHRDLMRASERLLTAGAQLTQELLSKGREARWLAG